MPAATADPVRLGEVVAYVARVHARDVDKSGEPYVGHLLRVWAGVWRGGGSLDAQLAALLHDVMEDHGVTASQLRALGVSGRVVEVVELVTRDVPADEYYARIAGDADAVLVKRADIADNTDPRRLALLAPPERERLADKYARATRLLGPA